jgi:hypothetical protein
VSTVQRRDHVEIRHCACGSAFRASSSDPAAVAEILDIWQMCHADAPHRPVTAREAANARRRQARALGREITAEVGA